MQNCEILRGYLIKEFLDETWKYYHLFKERHVPSIVVLKFDFSNNEKIMKSILSLVKYVYSKYDIELIKSFVPIFLKNEEAASIKFKDFELFIFNSAKELKNIIILHEFTHYLQDSFNVEIFNLKNQDKISFKDLKFLGLTFNEYEKIINICKKEKEIIPYINEFCENFDKISNEKVKKIFLEYFLNKIINENSKEFIKEYFQYAGNLTSLYVILICKIFDLNWDEVEKIILKN